ncbi:hypothetical protein GUI12_01515 [Anaplasmataceae bacterium AB001_6]|nr:hypothetical protein GUI12_01515 [Anaplasmataceae bacterium AB001_6]
MFKKAKYLIIFLILFISIDNVNAQFIGLANYSNIIDDEHIIEILKDFNIIDVTSQIQYENLDPAVDLIIIFGGNDPNNNIKIEEAINNIKKFKKPVITSGYATLYWLDIENVKQDTPNTTNNINMLKLNPISYLAKYINDVKCNIYDTNGWIYFESLNTNIPLIKVDQFLKQKEIYRIVGINPHNVSVDITESLSNNSYTILFREAIELSFLAPEENKCIIDNFMALIKGIVDI